MTAAGSAAMSDRLVKFVHQTWWPVTRGRSFRLVRCEPLSFRANQVVWADAYGISVYEEGQGTRLATVKATANKLLDQGEELLLRIGRLIAACPRYRQPGREAPRRGRPRRRR